MFSRIYPRTGDNHRPECKGRTDWPPSLMDGETEVRGRRQAGPPALWGRVSWRRCGWGGRPVVAGPLEPALARGGSPPEGGALSHLVHGHPTGAHLASSSRTASFLPGFCGVLLWNPESPEHRLSQACMLSAADRWSWVGCGAWSPQPVRIEPQFPLDQGLSW